MAKVVIVGGGLAGSEAAWQLAKRGWQVDLWEMRPETTTPAHHTALLAELVCSNSLGSLVPETAAGQLKFELEQLDSLILNCAKQCRVAAGSALAVDRQQFAQLVTSTVANHPNITLVRARMDSLPPPPAIIATGPLTADNLAEALSQVVGQTMLSFYDAAAPIVYADSIDYSVVYRASRYGKGGADYLNCPLNEEAYNRFHQALVSARGVERKSFEGKQFFEHCLPIEEIARRGYKTLAFGPLRPVGLEDPRTGKRPLAVVQLRQEDSCGNLYNMVGFQTNLLWPEQKRVFRLVPGLEKAEFARFGVMHRNTYVNSPQVLTGNCRIKNSPGLYIAGQLAGVEGYLESVASGLAAALDLWASEQGQTVMFPPETIIGGLIQHLQNTNPNFQPMNANFGLLPPVDGKDRRARRQLLVERARHRIISFAITFAN